MAYLVGRLNLTKSPPVLDVVKIASAPAGSLTSFGSERWVDLLPNNPAAHFVSHTEGFEKICKVLILNQDFFRWMEPILDMQIINKCFSLQGIDGEVAYAVHKMRYNPEITR